MKPTTIYLAVIICILTSCSHCEDDSPGNDNKAVLYRINVDEPIISEVQYMDANGQIISENVAGESIISWHRTEFVDDAFHAYKKVKFLNISNTEVNYTLRLFVDGTMIHKKEGSVSPESEGTAEIQYSVLD
jgi:hypothetical protein